MNPANDQAGMARADDGPREGGATSTNNPQLQAVNYVTILPEGKTSGYKENQQIDFKIDPIQFPYVDGKQSYLLLNVTPTGTFSNVSATADVPLMFPPNMGANSLVNRLTLRVNDGTGKIIEDREAYNLYNGIQNSYAHDSDVFPALAKVEAVSGRSNDPINKTVDNINNCYFYPQPTATSNTSAAGNDLIQNSFVIPIQLGLFSAFGNQHHAVPNMDIGGCHLTYHLEKANIIMNTMASKFYQTKTVNSVAVNVVEAREFTSSVNVTFSDASNFTINQAECDCNLVVDGVEWSTDFLAWRVGMPVKLGGGQVSVITDIVIDGGLVKVTLQHAIGTPGADTVEPDEISKRDYTIDKVELRVLNTVPDANTMKDIRRSVMRGLNFNSTQLYKISTASNLKNAIVDVPESLTKCLSLMAVPCQQDKLNSVDSSNSYIFPRPDSIINNNDNEYAYQWQVRQVLIPNLQVETNKNVDTKNDNVIYFNQLLMAQRPMYDVRSLADAKQNQTINKLDINLPYFFPLLLAPLGTSFDLIDSAPQLRVENSDASNTSAKLYFIFVNHVRMIKGSEAGIDVEF